LSVKIPRSAPPAQPAATKRRRDPRFCLDSRTSSVELTRPDALRARAPLCDLSVAGLAFRLADRAAAPTVGAVLPGATVRIGDHQVVGDLLVRNVRAHDAGIDVGCLFYPRGPSNERALFGILGALERRERAAAGSAVAS
jgi:hypothetical protein